MLAIDQTFLRKVLLVDAATCLASGLLMTFGAGPVSALTGLDGRLLTGAGLSLFPIAAFIAFVATRTPVWAPGVWLIILGNVCWVAGCIAVLAGWNPGPGTLGALFLLMQAAAVALLTSLEYVGLRRVTAAV